MSAGLDPVRSHERLIDHFKRVYSIVAGLALTEACRRTLPIDDPGDFRVWMFLAFFVTFVPIFHGGDRSLDEKYLGLPPQDRRQRLAFVWDDYMLLLTAVLFVCIAESIPRPSDAAEASPFYRWMAIMFGFDVFVLAVDLVKNWHRRDKLKPYRVWIPGNILLGLLCLGVSASAVLPGPGPRIAVPYLGTWSLSACSMAMFAAALVRTGVDYWAGEIFLFPRPPTADAVRGT